MKKTIFAVFVVVLVGVAGYFSAKPATPRAVNSPTNTVGTTDTTGSQSTLPLPLKNGDWRASSSSTSGGSLTDGNKYIVGPAVPSGFVFSEGCNAIGASRKMVDSSATYWAIDCGTKANVNSRATMGPILERQGWTFCDSGLGSAHWWKDGVVTGVSEGDGLGTFQLVQFSGDGINVGCR